MFNISMLKRVFNPTFELHDIKQTGEYEATTRWWAAAQEPLHLHCFAAELQFSTLTLLLLEFLL